MEAIIRANEIVQNLFPIPFPSEAPGTSPRSNILTRMNREPFVANFEFRWTFDFERLAHAFNANVAVSLFGSIVVNG